MPPGKHFKVKLPTAEAAAEPVGAIKAARPGSCPASPMIHFLAVEQQSAASNTTTSRSVYLCVMYQNTTKSAIQGQPGKTTTRPLITKTKPAAPARSPPRRRDRR